MASRYYVAFWNVENLFDVEGSPRRSDKIARAIGQDIQGWTETLLNRKVSQLASVIKKMNAGRGPDILGLCEIENAYVIDLLVKALAPLGRNYAVIHHDMSDDRGIDIGFIYDAKKFSVEKYFSHFVMRRTATRDILQVNFMTTRGRRLVLVGNHWPSRIGGVMETSGYRAIAGETLAYFHERILEVHGADTPVLAMGDFNDEPFDLSLTQYVLGVRNKIEVLNARSPKLLNLMWPLMGTGVATHYFENTPNFLDQFLANKNMLKATAPIKISGSAPQIIKVPEMVEAGDYQSPRRFGGMGKPVDMDGFSDHYPISVTVTEAD